jgi:hypothetical protein
VSMPCFQAVTFGAHQVKPARSGGKQRQPLN